MTSYDYNFSWPQDDVPATSRIVSCPPGAQAPFSSGFDSQYARYPYLQPQPQSQLRFSYNFSNFAPLSDSAYAYTNPPPSFSSNARPPAQPPPPPVDHDHTHVPPDPNAHCYPTGGVYAVPSTAYYAPPPYPPPPHISPFAISQSHLTHAYTPHNTRADAASLPARQITPANAYYTHCTQSPPPLTQPPPPLPPNKPTPPFDPNTRADIAFTRISFADFVMEPSVVFNSDVGVSSDRELGLGNMEQDDIEEKEGKGRTESDPDTTPHISWASYLRSQGVSPISPVARRLGHGSTFHSNTTTTSSPIFPTDFDTPASTSSVSRTTTYAELETDMGTEYGASANDIRNALALEVLLGGAMSGLDLVAEEDGDEACDSEVQDNDECDWDYDDQGVDDGAYFLRCALAAASCGDDTYLVDFLVLGMPVPFSFRRHIFTVNNCLDDGRGRILPRACFISSVPAHDTNLATALSDDHPDQRSTSPVTLALVDDTDRIQVITMLTLPNLPPPIDFNSNPPSGELQKFLSVLLGDQILASLGPVPSSTDPSLLESSLSLSTTPSSTLSSSDVNTQLSDPMNLLSFSEDEYEFILNPFQGEISGQGFERSCDAGDWGSGKEYCLGNGVLEEIGQVDDVGPEHVGIGEEIVHSGDGPAGCSESGGVIDGLAGFDSALRFVDSRRGEYGQFRLLGCPDTGGAFCDSEGDFLVCWDPGGA